MKKTTEQLLEELNKAFQEWYWLPIVPSKLRQGSGHFFDENGDPITDEAQLDKLYQQAREQVRESYVKQEIAKNDSQEG